MDEATQRICLAPMAHLSEAKCAEDDWRGISDQSVRKQRQNRLNQRAYRRRRILNKSSQEQEVNNDLGQDRALTLAKNSELGRVHSGPYSLNTPFHHQRFIRQLGQFSIEVEHNTRQIDPCRPAIQSETSGNGFPPIDKDQRSRTLTVMVASKKITFNPFEYCPLPSDHLLSLVRYNLYRAVAANSWSLGIDPMHLHSDIPSPFVSENPDLQGACLSLPPPLCPTDLQKRVPHHPYIDLFPFSQMRNCLMTIGDAIDEDELCADFAGVTLDSEFNEHTGLIVWGEPWHPHSWEMSETLWKKWSWLFRECSDVLEATNYWRQRRGEPCLTQILE